MVHTIGEDDLHSPLIEVENLQQPSVDFVVEGKFELIWMEVGWSLYEE